MSRFSRAFKVLERWELIIFALFIIVGGFLFYHFRYSVSVTSGLAYPIAPKTLNLPKQETIRVQRGITGEEHVYGLAAGDYVEVLANADGSFYLAPPMGFFKTARPKDGFAVGGIFVPTEASDHYYVWELPLKNHDRSFSSPNPARTLFMDRDQPERELFLIPGWYESNENPILGRPLIDTDFQIAKNKFAPKN